MLIIFNDCWQVCPKSRHTLCLIITTQFTTDWRNGDVQRRFFVNCLNFYKRRKRSCLSSLLFLPHQDERWLHFPNCLAVLVTDCKRFGLPCRSSLFALVCGMIAILISIFKVSATLKIAIFPYLRFQRFQIGMLESFLLKKKSEENIISVERYQG